MTGRSLLALTVVLALGLGSCATPSGSRGADPASSAPRVRCLSDPQQIGSARPLIFFFCIESP